MCMPKSACTRGKFLYKKSLSLLFYNTIGVYYLYIHHHIPSVIVKMKYSILLFFLTNLLIKSK